MVNTKIISRYTGPLPEGEGADRKISGGPLYQAHEVLQLLENGGGEAITAWTDKCVRDIQKWALDADDQLELLRLAVNGGRFICAEWCVQNPSGPWAACDAYSVVRSEWIQAMRREINTEYYIKFAIGKTGTILLLVSCHPPEERR